MSRVLLAAAIAPLPYALRDDVLGYATFVRDVAPERAAEMDITLTREQRDHVVWVASVIYMRDLVAGQLALAETATGRGASAVARTGVRGLKIGNDELSRGSSYLRRLRKVRNEMNSLLREANVPPTVVRLTDAIELVAATEPR